MNNVQIRRSPKIRGAKFTEQSRLRLYSARERTPWPTRSSSFPAPSWRGYERRPDLPRYMAGGPENPLGARALYLGSTLYRIHGSNEPWSIGSQVSSGCIRMRNDDVTDLYDRVKVGTKVVVM